MPTWYVKRSGAGTGEYSDLSTWESTEQTTLTAPGIVYCSLNGGSADTRCVVSGWGTDATNTLTIESSDDHGGKWDATAYHIEASNNANLLSIDVSYVRINGIQINNTHNTGDCLYFSSNLFDCEINKCIFKTTSSTKAGQGVDTGAGTTRGQFVFRNCLSYDFSGTGGQGFNVDSGPYNYNAANSPHFYNCSAIDCDTGFALTRDAEAINCFAYSGNDGFGSGDVWAGNSNYNLSNISGDAPGTVTVYTTQTTAQLFTDYANDDFSFASASSDGVDDGTDTSGLGISDDIKGTSRGATYDIGAFEFAAVATRRIFIVS